METQPNNRPRFKVAGNATIKHLNVRKEGPDDDQQLAVDVKLEFNKIGRAPKARRAATTTTCQVATPRRKHELHC